MIATAPTRLVRIFRRIAGSAILLLLSCSWTVLSAPPADDDPFAPSNAIDAKAAKAKPDDDPFAPANIAAAPKPGATSVKEVGKRPPTADRIDLTLTLDPTTVRRGEIAKLTIVGKLRPGFHTYPIGQRTPNQDEGYLTSLDVEATPGLKPLWPLRETDPEFVDTKSTEGIFLEYDKSFTWSQDILVLPDAPPGATTVRFKLKIQVCDSSCVRGTYSYEAALNVSDAPPVALTDGLKNRLTLQPEIKVVPVPAKVGAAKTESPSKESKASPAIVAPPDRSLLGILLSSMGAAIAMLFTPCVFPMIPITVSFFVKQSERKDHRPLLTAGVYSLTIIIVLSLAVILLGGFIVTVANNAWMNLGLGVVLIYFALSLFGMYEIELPSGLARFTSAREGQGGFVGAIFMALTFTITSFTCTGPFLGPLLVTAATMKLSTAELILAAFAYSATFAAPFFVLALFPTLLKAMPKSGGWLNAIKVVMGFLELAAALKFLGNTDATLNPGSPWFFTYDTVLCAWIALSVACGFYLLGLFRLPHDSPIEHVGVVRMLLATIFFGLALHLTPALWRETPLSVVGEGLVAFLPRDTRPVVARGGNGGTAEAELTWHLDYQAAWEQANRENKLIFIDFTGVNCTNCRDNEDRVFKRNPGVRDELAKYVRVQLYNDSVPKPGLSKSQAEKEADQNREWQENTFHDVTTPLYVLFKPAKDKAIIDGKLNGVELGRRGGKIFPNEIDQFVSLLKGALNGRQVAQAGMVP